MKLNERKQKILKAIIKKYIESAEPISSKTILKEFSLSISSATIRNEMAALEEMGLISQPHISSGRIPVYEGYRYYVDYLMDEIVLNIDEKHYIINSLKKELKKKDDYTKKVGQFIASVSNYIVFITEEKEINNKIEFIKLIDLKNSKILLIITSNFEKTKNYLINYISSITKNELDILSNMLTLIFKKKFKISKFQFEKNIKKILPKYVKFSKKIFMLIKNIIEKNKKSELFIEGIRNIFKQPEFNQVSLIESFLSILEEKNLLLKILNKNKNKIEIKIGKEIGIEPLNNYALITSPYKLKNYVKGKIAILGPTRMNYAKSIELLKTTLEFLNNQK